jgi:hypothetical protein
MAAMSDADVSFSSTADIRWTGAATTNRHTVKEFIVWLQGKMDDGQAVGDDILDIIVDTPFDRSTDQILALLPPANIDDTFALHLYDGSVSQNNGDDLYSGLNIIGPVEAGTEYMVLQDGKVLAPFWGTGINPEPAPSSVFSRHLIKTRSGGADIDAKRVVVLARELGDQFRRFPATLGTGNSVAAIANSADIFNAKTDAAIAAMTSIVNTEGFQELDIDGNGAAGQEFYSQYDKGVQVTNDVFERSKWITQRAHIADLTAGTPTGTDFVIDNATIVGQGQSFIPLAATERLVEVRAKIKILAGVPTGDIHCELWDSDDVAAQLAKPTGGVLMRSEPILATSITSAYEDVIFRFNRLNPATGATQNVSLTNAEYFVVFRHPTGTAGANFSLEGAATDQDATMNQADDTAAVWTASATDDINITVKTSPVIHNVPGEIFQGINIEVGFDGEAGTGFVENEVAIWGTDVTYDTLVGTFIEGEYVTFTRASVIVSAGKILHDNGTVRMVVSLQNPAASIIQNNDIMTGLVSGATAAINVTIVDEAKSGGEGIVLAKDDNGVTGEGYLQVISGSDPIDNNIIRSATTPFTNLANATAVLNARTINPEFLGTSTGTNIIGVYGIGFQPADVGSSDKFRSLDNAVRTPKNNVIFTVAGMVASEDRVLVGPRTGVALDRGQWLLATALTGATETAVVVKTGTDTVPWAANTVNWPSTGTSGQNSKLRIQLDSNIYRRVSYQSHDGTDTFTILSTSFTGGNSAAINRNVFLAFIDVLASATTETFTGVHGGVDRNLFVRARDGGGTPTKTFESTSAQFLATPQVIAITRVSDS